MGSEHTHHEYCSGARHRPQRIARETQNQRRSHRQDRRGDDCRLAQPWRLPLQNLAVAGLPVFEIERAAGIAVQIVPNVAFALDFRINDFPSLIACRMLRAADAVQCVHYARAGVAEEVHRQIRKAIATGRTGKLPGQRLVRPSSSRVARTRAVLRLH